MTQEVRKELLIGLDAKESVWGMVRTACGTARATRLRFNIVLGGQVSDAEDGRSLRKLFSRL